MGLDGYVYAVKPATVKKFKDPDCPTFDEFEALGVTQAWPKQTELQYWRKHWGIHLWFYQEALYRGDVDPKEEFNGVSFRLDRDVLKDLERDVRSGEVRDLGGGYSEGYGHSKTKDLAFIRKARAELRRGNTLYYISSW